MPVLFLLGSFLCTITALRGISRFRVCDLDGVYCHAGSEQRHSCDCCRPALKVYVEVCVFDDGRNAICHLDNFVLHGGNLLCCVQGLVFLWFYSSTGIYACIESRLLFFIAPFVCVITVL